MINFIYLFYLLFNLIKNLTLKIVLSALKTNLDVWYLLFNIIFLYHILSTETGEIETFLHAKYSSETQYDDIKQIVKADEASFASQFPKENTISENIWEFIVRVA